MTMFAPKRGDKKETSGHQHAQSATISEEYLFAGIDALPDLRLVHANPRVLSLDAVLHLQRTLAIRWSNLCWSTARKARITHAENRIFAL